MKTLAELWNETELKPIPVVSNSNQAVLIQAEVNGGYYLGKPMASKDQYYLMDSTSILLDGDVAIWELL